MNRMRCQRKLLSIGSVTAIALLVSGCGSSVDCNDSKSKATAVEIIQSRLNQATWYKQLGSALTTPELVNIKTVTSNDELKSRSCSGQYSFSYNKTPRTIDVTYLLSYLQDKKETEVKVYTDDVAAGLMAMVMRERPQYSPEELAKQQAEQKRVVIEALETQIRDIGTYQAFSVSEVKLSFDPAIEGSQHEKYRAQMTVHNGTQFPVKEFWYHGCIRAEDEQVQECGGYSRSFNYQFEQPIMPSQSLTLDLTQKQLGDGITVHGPYIAPGKARRLVTENISQFTTTDGKQYSLAAAGGGGRGGIPAALEETKTRLMELKGSK